MVPVFHRQTSLYSLASGRGLTSPRFTLQSVKAGSSGGTITASWRQKAVATHGSPGGHRRGRVPSLISIAPWWRCFRGHVRGKRGICWGAETVESELAGVKAGESRGQRRRHRRVMLPEGCAERV